MTGRWRDRLDRVRARADRLEREVDALAGAVRDERTPWYAKALALVTVGYVLSPVDPIPDVIPVVGFLDELLVVPMLAALTRRLVPEAVLDAHRDRAADRDPAIRRARWAIAALTVACWLLVGGLAVRYLLGAV